MTKAQTRALIYIATLLSNISSFNQFRIKIIDTRLYVSCNLKHCLINPSGWCCDVVIDSQGLVVYFQCSLLDTEKLLGYDLWSLKGRQL